MKRALPVLALAWMLAACATPQTHSFETGAAGRDAVPEVSPAKPSPACQPEPFCYRDCLRGYQPAYCRYKCGC
ncbi:MAG: hypothetical protein ABI440_06600 [Casimicrobiaceae bacterium]